VYASCTCANLCLHPGNGLQRIPCGERLCLTRLGLTRLSLVWRAHSSLSKKKLPVLDNYWPAAFFIERQKISTANIDISTNIFDEMKNKIIK